VQEMGADGQKANQVGKGHQVWPVPILPQALRKTLQKGNTKKNSFYFFSSPSQPTLHCSDIHPRPKSSSLPTSSPSRHLFRPHKSLSEMTGPKKEGQKKEYYITSDGYDQVSLEGTDSMK
jgi:hypothetical protein